MKKCLWLKTLGKHILISIRNYWGVTVLIKFTSGDVLISLGWISLFYCKLPERVAERKVNDKPLRPY